MAAELVYTIIFGLGLYLFLCFTFFKIGEKFGIGSLFEFCIPIYNGVMLCKCADISGWNILWLIIPGLLFNGQLQIVATIVTVIFSVVLWGRIAERMGRGFWQYGLGSALVVIPVFVLAFGTARPVAGRQVVMKGWQPAAPKPVDEPLYKPVPISANMPQAAPIPSSSANIYCLSGEFRGNTIPVPPEGITIGRDKNLAQLVFDSNEVSRQHARISIDSGNPRAVLVSDMQSTNGTFRLEGEKWVKITGSCTLPPGSRFRIGKSVAEFEVR